MTDVFSIAKLGMLSDLERMNSYSQNISNSGTTAYHRQVPVSVDFLSQLDLIRPYGQSGAGVATADLSVGALQRTGRHLDVAIEGDAFFSVQTPTGLAYTRRGDLHLDAEGRLVTLTGDAVLGEGGEIRLRSETPDIASTGEIRVDDQLVARLKLTRFADTSTLVYDGAGQFRATAESEELMAVEGKLRQGYIEMSNVQPLQDMLGMMQTSRNFQMSHTVLMAYDSMLDAAVNTLATF